MKAFRYSYLYQQTWVRPLNELGKAKRREQIVFEQKESYNWYKGMSEVNKLLRNDIEKIHIADREANLYELFFSTYEPNTDLQHTSDKAITLQPPTMSEAVKWIERLGGHLGRKSDGPPGLKVVWLGYQRIIDAASIYEMMSLENLGKG
jgi:hypothetical protein